MWATDLHGVSPLNGGQDQMANEGKQLLAACVLALACSRAPLAAGSADLGELSLERLMDMNIDSVYGASKYEQRVTQAPSSISIVTAAEIRRFGYRSMAEVLQSVRGLYVTNDRNYSYIGMRGFLRPGDYTTRVLVLIDGHRLNDNIYDSGSVGLETMIDVDLVDRIEVIRGPGSSLYGSSAFLGVINVITKQGHDVGGVELAADAANRDTYRTRATYGSTFSNNVDFLASATYYSSAGEDRIYYPELDQRISTDPRAAKDGLAIGLDDEHAAKFFTSLHAGDFSASAYFSDRTKQIPTASFETIFGDPAAATEDERSYVELGYKHALTKLTRLQASVSYDHTKYNGTFPYDYTAAGDRTLYRDATVGEWIDSQLQLTATPSDRYTVIVGGEYRANIREDQAAYDDVEPRVVYADERASSSVVGLFAQGEARVRDNLSVTAGVRYDRYRAAIGDTTSPRIALIYNPSANSAVKALYGQAFRAPNPYESYYNPEQVNHDLKPERIRTYELVYERYFDSTYRLSLSAYRYRIEGLITQAATPEDDRYFINLDDAQAHGVEVELEATYANDMMLRGSLAMQRAKDVASGVELSSSPHVLGKFNASSPVFHGKVFANLDLQYNSSSRTLSQTRSHSFVLTNITFTTRDWWRQVELTAGVYNAFNADHPFPGAEEHVQPILHQDGRTYAGKIVKKF
jgi:outer membrane receptor for ferrienterochelin and colicins